MIETVASPYAGIIRIRLKGSDSVRLSRKSTPDLYEVVSRLYHNLFLLSIENTKLIVKINSAALYVYGGQKLLVYLYHIYIGFKLFRKEIAFQR